MWPDLAKFRHFGQILKAFGQFLKGLIDICQFFNQFGHIFGGKFWLLQMAKFWKISLAIWSHYLQLVRQRIRFLQAIFSFFRYGDGVLPVYSNAVCIQSGSDTLFCLRPKAKDLAITSVVVHVLVKLVVAVQDPSLVFVFSICSKQQINVANDWKRTQVLRISKVAALSTVSLPPSVPHDRGLSRDLD